MASLSVSAHLIAVSNSRFEAFAYPPRLIGNSNWFLKFTSVPRRIGKTKSKRDHNSLRLFCIGVPDKMMRFGVRSSLQWIVMAVLGLRILCPSSRIAHSHSVAVKNSEYV